MHRLLAHSLCALVSALPLLSQEQAPEPGERAPSEALVPESFLRSAPWTAFLAETGGEWHPVFCAATSTPPAIWGSGIDLPDWRGSSIEEARRQARALLQRRSDLLGLGASEFREVIGARMGRTWAFVYDQYFRGIPVIGGRADVRVHEVGRIPMFGSRAFPIGEGFDVTPAIGPEVAAAVAWRDSGLVPSDAAQPAPARAPRLVIWGDVDAPAPVKPVLAWEVFISNVDRDGIGPIGRYYVDAKSAAVLAYVSDKHDCVAGGHGLVEARGPSAGAPLPAPVNTVVTVMAWTRTGDDAYSSLVIVPLPGLELSVPGVGTVVTDQNGQFTINISSPVTISVGALNGRHHASISGSSAPSGSFTVTPGVPRTIQLLTSGATTDQAAHTTASYWVDKTNEFCRAILGNTPQLATADNIVPTVNINSTCNAYYTSNTINFYRAGGGCANTAFSTVISHEWGHGLDDRYGGISQTQGLSEGWGDILGMYIVDSPILGSGFQTPGVGIRNGNNTRQYPPPAEVHAAGEVFMGFAWKLRDHLATTLASRPAAIALTNAIVLGTIPANATDQPTAVREIFIADDDDGNLANGTPHSADLIWACNQHSLPYPGGGGPTPPPNDDCANAITVVNGVNGPYTSVNAYTSSPSWACANGGADVWFRYVAGSAGTLTASTCNQATWDTAIEIFSGSCGSLVSLGCNDDTCSLRSTVSVQVSPGTYYIRVGGYAAATGTFSLDVTGPGGGGGQPASTQPYGQGCYQLSKAFYEMFSSSAFDLGGVSMRLAKTGGYYVASAQGAFRAPSAGATVLNLSDDSETTVALGRAFPYHGGTTTSLVVCSNGFVSAATGNGTSYSPSTTSWLASSQPRWGAWHDYNPAATGSGRVKFEVVGQVAFVTWDGVYDYGTTNPNTWQLQFDLANGDVTYAFQSLSGTGNSVLVGYAGAAPNTDLGSMDISVALPGTFRTGAANQAALSLSGTLPRLGTTLVLTTTDYPQGSPLGVQVLSLVQHNPGIDLTSAGMPGCWQYTGLENTVLSVPSGGQSTWSLPIPNTPSLSGLPLNAQTYAFASGANAAGVVSSNGVAMVIGI